MGARARGGPPLSAARARSSSSPLFHRHPVDRALHTTGLPLAIGGIYARLSSWPVLAEAVAGMVFAMHAVMAVRHRLLALLPLVIAANAALWLGARSVLSPLGGAGARWLLAPVAGATLAYVGHYLEPWAPPPFSDTSRFVPRTEWWRRVTPGGVARAATWAPAHIAVEAMSAPRNVFVLLVAAAAAAGLVTSRIGTLQHRAAPLIAHPDPPLTQAGFRAAPPAPGGAT